MLVNRNNTIDWQTIESLRGVGFVRGQSPFDYLPQPLRGQTKHHIIDCQNTLEPLWLEFTNYLRWILDNREAINEHVINSLKEFDNYIINTGGEFNPNNIAGVRNRVIWNPGNLAIGPLPANRGNNDPAQRNIFDPDAAFWLFGDRFNNQFTDHMDYDFLRVLKDSGEIAKPILRNFRNALREIQLLITNSSTHAIPQSLNNATDRAMAWGRFWQFWLAIYRPGYLQFEWTLLANTQELVPSRFIGNISKLSSDRLRNREMIDGIMQGNLQLGRLEA